MDLGSDKRARLHPKVAANLKKYATKFPTEFATPSNIDSAVECDLQRRLSEIFEREVAVFYLPTRPSVNSFALALVGKPGALVLAHHEANIVVDGPGAHVYFSNPLRTQPVEGLYGKMDLDKLRQEAERIARLDVPGGGLSAISVTQPTESGTLYSLEELDQIAAIAKSHNASVHMDGATFANGLVSLDCTPAEMTWKRGVDVLSFCGTNNGCSCAEVIILFDPSKMDEFSAGQKQTAQLFSKARFISAQLEGYLHDDLWLNIAQHSNAMAAELSVALNQASSTQLVREPQSKEVFAILNKRTVSFLKSQGVLFMEWPVSPDIKVGVDEQLCRFVTSFATTRDDIQRFTELINTIVT